MTQLTRIEFCVSTANRTKERDDTGSNSVNMRCGSGEPLPTEFLGYRGYWSKWATCPSGMAIDGMRVQIEERQGGGDDEDDTAMNGLKLSCNMVPGMG